MPCRLYLTLSSQIVVVQVYVEATCPAPLTAVEITGPTLGEISATHNYRIRTTPSNLTPPITYTWSPVPLTGQTTAEVIYAWSAAGDNDISVPVEQYDGFHTPTLDVKIVAGELDRIYLPLALK